MLLTVVGLSSLLTLWALVFVIVDRAVILRQLIGAGLVEAALLVQLLVAGAGQLGGHEVSDPVTLWGYLIVALLLLPVATAWALAERTRWSSVVLAVAAFAIVVMEGRIWQVWGA